MESSIMVDSLDAICKTLEYYRQMCPVPKLIKTLSSDPEWLTYDFQCKVVSTIINDPVREVYGPSPRYTLRFLKSYLKILEDPSNEVEDISESLLSELMVLVMHIRGAGAADISAEEMHHLVFKINSSTTLVKVRVASMSNEVGLKLWEAGYYLTEFALLNPGLCHRHRVLELGAGVGFTGLAIAADENTTPEAVLMTDYAPEVLQNLAYNVEINEFNVAQSGFLDWNSWTIKDALDFRPTIILCADCVYDIEAFPVLVSVLDTFFSYPNDMEEDRKAIFAVTLRNIETFKLFLLELERQHMKCESITEGSGHQFSLPSTDEPMFEYSNRDSVHLWVISK